MALYQTLPSLLPLPFTPYSQVAVTDIDGDQVCEVIVLNSDILQLGIAHQFSFSEMVPPGWSQYTNLDWSQDTDLNWIHAWASNTPGASSGTFTVQMGDQMLVADFNGDGTDEFFLYNVYNSTWRIARWSTITGQLELICPQCSGVPQWTIQPYDQYFVFPNPNGQAGAGILAFNTQSLALGVLLYSNGALSAPTVTPGGDIDNWTFEGLSQQYISRFVGGHFVQAGQGAFMVFNPTANYVACLTWDGQAFHVSRGQNHQVGGWSLGSGDQYQVADLDGNGLDELFLYNPDGYLGVWNWSAGQGQAQWECPVCTKSVNGLSIGGQDQYLATMLPGQTYASIVAYGQQRPQIGVLSCTDLKSFTFQPADFGTAWQVTSKDQYFAAPLTSSAQPRLIVASVQNGNSAMGAISTGTAGLSFASSSALPVPGWTPTYLATQAPSTPASGFPAFSSAQMPIYQYLSNLLTLNATSDLRSVYTNGDYQDQFSGYLSTLTNATVPAGENWQSSDWDYVQTTLRSECNAISLLYGLYKSLRSLSGTLHTQQGIDLTQVESNVQLLASDDATVTSYWLSQAGVAALWGLGAGAALFLEAPPAAVLAVVCSVAASLLGSLFNEFLPPEAPAPQVSYGQIKAQIAATFANTKISNCTAPGVILSDPIKLQIVGQLANTTWNMDQTDWTAVIAAAGNADRIAMYQQLLPYSFEIGEVTNANIPAPYYWVSTGHFMSWKREPFGQNNSCYLAVPIGAEAWNDYVMYVPGPTAPPSTLVSDLAALGVQRQMLLGAGQWSVIPRTTYNGIPG